MGISPYLEGKVKRLWLEALILSPYRYVTLLLSLLLLKASPLSFFFILKCSQGSKPLELENHVCGLDSVSKVREIF